MKTKIIINLTRLKLSSLIKKNNNKIKINLKNIKIRLNKVMEISYKNQGKVMEFQLIFFVISQFQQFTQGQLT